MGEEMGELSTVTGVQASLSTSGGFELIQRIANMFSNSTMVPQEYRGKQGMANCIVAMDIAQRMNISPMMCMQNLHIIHGRPAWGAPFLIASVNSSGKFSAIRYEFNDATGDDYGCRAVATERLTGMVLEGAWITLGLAKAEGWYGKSGSKWKTMPEQMLRYRAASWWVRAYAPEISMGMLTDDEAEDIAPAPAQAVRPAVPVAHVSRVASEAEMVPDADDGPPVYDAEFVQGFRGQIAALTTIEEVATAWTQTRHELEEMGAGDRMRDECKEAYSARQAAIYDATKTPGGPLKYIAPAVEEMNAAATLGALADIIERCDEKLRGHKTVMEAIKRNRARIQNADVFPGDLP